MVHRDIKPANLLVSGGVVKISDLGLARWRRNGNGESSSKELTREGAVLGTLDYVAPEQAADSHAVDIRADLYSLGCTFYLLLTGRVPFPGGEAIEKLYRHRFEEPTPLEQVRPEVPAEVSAVVRKLMAKQPEERYQTPAEAAAALASVLQSGVHTPPPHVTPLDLAAAPAGRAGPAAQGADYVIGSVAVVDTQPLGAQSAPRRSRWSSPIAGLLVAGMVVVGGTIFYLSRGGQPVASTTDERTKPTVNVAKATTPSNPIYVSGPTREESLLATLEANHLPTLEGKWHVIGPYDNTNRQAESAVHAPELAVYLEKGDKGKGGMPISWTELPAFKAGWPISLCTDARLTPPMSDAAESACFYAYHVVEVPRTLTLPVSVTCNGTLTVWLNGEVVASRKVAKPMFAELERMVLNLKPGKNQLLAKVCTGSRAIGELYVLPLFPQPLDKLFGDQPQREVERLITHELRWFKGHIGTVTCVAFSPNGKQGLSTGEDKIMRLWDLEKGGSWVREYRGAANALGTVVCLPDGKRALTAGGTYNGIDNTVRLWELATGKELRPAFEGHKHAISSLALTADGSRVYSGGWDGAVRAWDVEGNRPPAVFPIMGNTFVNCLALSADGTFLLAGCRDRTVRVLDVQNGKERGRFTGHTDSLNAVALAPDGKLAASGGHDRTIRLWEPESCKETLRIEGHAGNVNSVVFSKDGQVILSASGDRTIRVWDRVTGRELRRLVGHTGGVRRAVFSPDEHYVLSGSEDGSVRLWSLVK
jgi:hypothetical protein